MTLSDSCLRTLNTNVTECSPGLFYHSPNPDLIFETLVNEELAEICHEICYKSLLELRPKIESACNTEMDAVAFLYEDKIFPPTYMVDLLLLLFNVYCYRDRVTGKLCDLQFAEWRIHRESDKPLECEDCMLGPLKIQLQAGISYNNEDASEFQEMTSSCDATGYEYSKPAPYATTLSSESWATMAKSPSTTPTP
ncbi:uncharacterized protein BKA55DRAFT_152516 [Fusarium redolens]|uniref:Uncharacterized protein n=1 Tax=Fusarium redolens TaxID=48865 RepID=A0A9P9KQU6_FUSRE|nr:uncharacterized protein BKA55DRAFT_152516 [Fusarium redolens]KAH7266822.1 hypothetical protein BKA55DRAFT_152516 [Fusarium redolens]